MTREKNMGNVIELYQNALKLLCGINTHDWFLHIGNITIKTN